MSDLPLFKRKVDEENEQLKQRINGLEQERNEIKELLANIMECSTKECMCGSSIPVGCGHGGCVSTADYHAIPHAKELLQKHDLEQQAKGIEDAATELASPYGAIPVDALHEYAKQLRKKAKELDK